MVVWLALTLSLLALSPMGHASVLSTAAAVDYSRLPSNLTNHLRPTVPSGGSGNAATTPIADPVVSAGDFHTVGLKLDGTVVAVGLNSSGQCNVNNWNGVVQVSGGGYHTVGLKSDGTVVAVGYNYYGQCNVNSWTDIAQVAAGGVHTVALKSNGTVVAVGSNGNGQGSVSTWANMTQVSASTNHTVGLKSDGTAVAVGDNFLGQCNVDSWGNITQVSAGYGHTVGLKADGTVVAVGDNEFGQCNVSGWDNITQVSASYWYTVGLKSDGTVVAIGDNTYGQCDVGSWTSIVQISARWFHTVGLKSDGTVVAVGDNSYGQGNVLDWNLPSQPTVTTNGATSVANNSATLNGTLNSLGIASSVMVSFQWGTTTGYGNETTPQPKGSVGTFSANLTTLIPGTTYHFRAKAVGDGTSYGDDTTFTTGTTPPTVTTNAASAVSTTSATLNGNLGSLGTAASVQVSFQWGTTTGYGNETTPQPKGSVGTFSANLTTLTPGTTYHFRAKAVGDGTSYGNDLTFTTTTSGSEIQIALKAGWNMVSVPVTPANNSVNAVFPGAAAVYTWDPSNRSYLTPTTVDIGKGYWVAVAGDTTITVTGAPVANWTTDIKAGWNMIGSVINNASIISPNDNPDGSLQPFAYWWDPLSKAYQYTTETEPGKGYWVASVSDCKLTLP